MSKGIISRAFLVVIGVLTLLSSSAFAEPLALRGSVEFEAVSAKMSYLEDPDHRLSVEEVVATDFAGFTPVGVQVPNFGYTKSAIWLSVPIVNEGAGTAQWVADFHDNFKQEFAGYLIRADGTIETGILLEPDSPFGDRPLNSPQMSMPFALAEGEAATLLIRYWSEGSSAQSMSIITQAEFDRRAAITNARNFVFYGMITAFVLVALGSAMLFRSTVALAYATYTSCVLLYVMHSDGVAYQYIYPNAPAFNNIVSVVWGGGFIFFGAIYTRLFLRTGRDFPWVDRALKSVAAIVLLFCLSAFVSDPQIVKQSLVFVALIGLATFVISGLVVARRHFREVRFFVIAWGGAVVSAAMMNLTHQLGIDLSPAVQLTSLRLVIITDAALMGLAILDRYNQLRNARQAALEQVISQSERNLVLAQRVSELQSQSAHLEYLARQQDQDFADRIHDLRQPLTALQLRVRDGIKSGSMSTEHYTEMQAALSYLETLVKDYKAQSEPGLANASPKVAAADIESVRALSLNDVLNSIHEMFEPDAEAKGLDFRYVPTTRSAAFDPLSLMRATINLVSNAIRYTEQGKILLGCRAGPEGLRIEVHDTGAGLSPAELDLAFRRDIRLAKPGQQGEGTGNGLAITRELAEKNGWQIVQLSRQSMGTSLAIILPD